MSVSKNYLFLVRLFTLVFYLTLTVNQVVFLLKISFFTNRNGIIKVFNHDQLKSVYTWINCKLVRMCSHTIYI